MKNSGKQEVRTKGPAEFTCPEFRSYISQDVDADLSLGLNLVITVLGLRRHRRSSSNSIRIVHVFNELISCIVMTPP